MNPHYPKAVWGFNGTERPGAVYLAAVLAGHAQKGLPAFGIYGRDVQDLDDNKMCIRDRDICCHFHCLPIGLVNLCSFGQPHIQSEILLVQCLSLIHI